MLFPAAALQAQQSFFNFSYNGPDTLYVGPTCSSMLQGNVPNPVVTSTVGANIITSVFDPVASGFQYDDIFTEGTVAHVFWFVEDDAGHSYTFEYFIFFSDLMPPVFDLTGVFNVLEFSSIVEVPAQVALPVSDNCTMVVSDTFFQSTPPDTCQSGTFTRTWIATDANDNTAIFTQTIIIYKDTLPPVITGYPQNGAAPCEQLELAYPAWRDLQIATFAATDASGIKELINNAPDSFPAGCKVPLVVNFWAVDNCMIQLPVSVTFTTSDTEAPVVVSPPRDTVAYCSQNDQELQLLGEWIHTMAWSQVYDSCSYPLVFSMQIAGNNVDSSDVVQAYLDSFAGGCSDQMIGNQTYPKVRGRVTVGFFVEDDCGNKTGIGSADFGAIDTLPPAITGVNATEQCGGGNDQNALQAWINAHGNAVVTEDCSGFTWTNFSFTTSSGASGTGLFNAGPYPSVQANNCNWFADVTFRATDDCGNSQTITLRWRIVDTQAPVITGLQPNITVYCPNPLPVIPAATVTDNCDANIAITFSRVYKDSLCDGSYTVLTTWMATDDCGNSSTATQDIFVRDTTRPVFTLVPIDRTFRCDTFVLPPVPVMGLDITANDVCSPVVSISTSTNSLQNPDPAQCGHYTYDIIRTFTATDECGNTRTASQTISVIDNLGPVPGGVLDTTALCSALTPFPAPVPLATDACSGPTPPPVQNGQTNVPGSCDDEYIIEVHWVATDVCGNTTAFDQLVRVIDSVAPVLVNIPPNITVECDAIPAAPETALFNPSDNCDANVTVTLLETEIRNPDTMSCEHWTDYILQREWTATDNCGNARTYTQQIQIEDTTPPAIIPPGNMIIPNDPGLCGANMLIPSPLSVTDVCSDQTSQVVIMDMKPLIPSGPGSPFAVPVASMSFQLNAPNSPPFAPVQAGPVLRVILDFADAEGATEDFNVYDENGVLLGKADTDSQCGSKTNNFFPTPAVVNAWLFDGVAHFSVVPNGSGPAACNPVCAGGKVTVRLEYQFSGSDVPIGLVYSVDGGPAQNFPPSGPDFLSTGVHTIVYTATDCANNSSTASMMITVNDTEAPVVTAPANITAYTGQNNCESTVTLPFPVISENCAMSENLVLSSAVLPLQFENSPDVGIVAADVNVPLTGIVPNAVGNGILRIRHLGDNAQPGEFFEVYDEVGNFLGSTAQDSVAGECVTFFETLITVSDVQINNWGIQGGAFGSTFFYLASNRDIVNYTDFVGNCAPLLPNGTDGISQVQVTLEYSYAEINYSVKNVANQTVASGMLLDNSTTVTLPPANYTVMYSTSDNAGLTGMASFGLTVRDTVKPKALCQPTFIIQVDPSGASPYILQASSINNGSTDNCTPVPNLTYSLSPATFTCNLAGSSVPVTLTVTDSSGNSATCQTIVGVTTTPPQPSYIPVCENGELQLFAGPPSASPYSYQWAGVNNYASNVQNPIVTSNAMAIHNGTYCVTVTGATGCTASACVVVQLAILGTTPPLNSNGLSFCPGQNISLSTETFQGINISYQWLVDSVNALPGGPVVLATTTTPVFLLGSPPPGQYVFYVKVFANGCNTPLSNAMTVTVHPTPPAAVNPVSILKCECETISLNATTPSFGGTLTYMWMGPGGFTSNSPTPLVTACAVEAQHEGLYTLTTQRFGCISNPATVQVNINPKPPKPSLTGVVNVCAGQTITLTCNVLSGDQWIWTSPTFDTYITDPFSGGNVLQIPNANASHEGNWSVIVRANNCFSDESQPIRVDVQQYPVITASSNGPICKDSLLLLSASFSSADTLSWVWTYPDGTQQFLQNPMVPNGASGLYTVIARTSFGCADTATVNVTNVTPPTIDFISNNAPVCCDNTSDATLTATISTANPPLSYLWVGPPAFGTSTLASPVIADICTTFNGQYTLVVKDSFGCPSLPATTEINIQDPPAMPMLQVLDNTLCAGDSIFLFFNNPTNGANYTWNLPGGFTTQTSVPYLSLQNAQPGQSGLYTVLATSVNGLCVSGLSNAVSVTVHPIPVAPTITSNSPVCQGDVLTLSAPSISGAQYFWTGPFGFTSSDEDPVRMNVTTGMQGEYRLRVEVNGCSSPQSFLFVSVVPTPATPFIADAPDRICIDAPVTAFLNILNPVNGMEYTWVDADSGIPLLGPSTATSLNLSLPQVLALGPGAHSFRVQAQTVGEGCKSAFSNTITVVFDTIPEGINAFAGLDRFACVDNEIVLSGSPNPLPGIVSGFWTQVGTPAVTIDDAGSPNASFIGQANNQYTFVWSLSNGECKNFTRDTVVITAQHPEIPLGGPDILTCSLTGIQLQATQGASAQGMWVQLAQQAQLGVVIDNPLDPNTTISGNLNYGQNFAFYWQIGNIGCGVGSDEVIVYIYSNKPNAGAPQFVCNNQNCTSLSASVLGDFEWGAWTSSNPNITFTNPSSRNTTVCGLSPGANEVYWTINGGVCGDQSRDTVVIEYEIFPTAVNDFVSVEFGDTAHVNVLLNDILPSFYTVRVTVPPAIGRIDTLATGVYVYRPQSGYTGTETMTYQICNTKCPDACNSATVTFQVGGAPECIIPTIITPNGDGFNDAFTIPTVCTVGEGGTVEVTVFNQWGDMVFHADPYLNDWEGTYNSEVLPAGTYFYVVKISEEELPRKGFLLIQR